MKKKCHDQKIGQAGDCYLKKLNSGCKLKIEFMKDLNILKTTISGYSDVLVRFSEHFLFYTFNIGLENQELGHAQNSNFIFGKISEIC